ncbi:hypothetical protein D3C72_2499600 [compost metagenome]
MLSGSRHSDSSTSAKTGVKSEYRMAWFVETKVRGVVITSSPSAQPYLVLNSSNARCRPTVLEPRKCAWGRPV